MKNRIKLNESTLKQIIAESVSRVLFESQVYTREDWRRDGDINPRPGQIVADDVIEGLASNVPPKTWKHSIFQFGDWLDYLWIVLGDVLSFHMLRKTTLGIRRFTLHLGSV